MRVLVVVARIVSEFPPILYFDADNGLSLRRNEIGMEFRHDGRKFPQGLFFTATLFNVKWSRDSTLIYVGPKLYGKINVYNINARGFGINAAVLRARNLISRITGEYSKGTRRRKKARARLRFFSRHPSYIKSLEQKQYPRTCAKNRLNLG